MVLRTLLVGTDLTQRSDEAIRRGHQIAVLNDARFVVCHVGPGHVGSHPLFPQRHQEDVVSAAMLDETIAEAVSLRVVEVTERSPEAFDVVVDQGDVATVLAEQAQRGNADLIVVMTDRSEEGSAAIVTRNLARVSSCSVLIVGEPSGAGVAIVALEDEVDRIPALVSGARGVLAALPTKVDVVLLVHDREVSPSRLSAEVTGQAQHLGVALAPRFVKLADTSMLTRATDDASIGLVVMTAPAPDRLTSSVSSPIEDVLSAVRCSVLLLREA